jgi:L-amino acid N-acyltransferase YncA
VAGARRLAVGALDVKIDRAYPREVATAGGALDVTVMARVDRERVLALTRAIPEHDRLFLHRDVTRGEAVEAWLDEIERGECATLLAERDGALLGCATIEPERDAWSQHVAELRVLVAPASRGAGIGRALTREAFAAALSAGLEKLTVRMTPDQTAAIRSFEALGFTPEAMLRDHVKDGAGKKHDLLVLGHDVAAFHAMLEAYGVAEALGE